MCSMNFNGNSGAIPAGMRDWLPPEAGEKRALINTLLKNISAWGYSEISSPLLEYYQVFNKSEAGTDSLYKLIERDGSILALRPEMTIPIARIIGSKLSGNPPWRLMYGEEVFRYELVQAGRQRGFNQVGVELVGEKGPEADCEVLALAISSLKCIGLEKFKVSLGHMGVFKALLGSLALEETLLEELRKLILEKDFAGLHEFLERVGLKEGKAEELLRLLTQPLSLEDIKRLTPTMQGGIQTSLQEIIDIIELLEAYGYAQYIQVDLSTLRSQEYYTGVVFEIYTAGIGYPIGGGGRYDNLLCQYGKDCPATGFALGIERIILSMPSANEMAKPILLVGDKAAGIKPEALAAKAKELRGAGRQVILELRTLGREQAAALAEKMGAELLLWQGSEK
ncbi:MAG: ATP phosphoribosyltransferase regulatory subunit [Desulfocucumaceae bacterium]